MSAMPHSHAGDHGDHHGHHGHHGYHGHRGNRLFLLRMLLWSLARRRSRLLVALVGITIGATVLLGLITLCFEIPRQMSQEFRSYGANLVLVDADGLGRMTRAAIAQASRLLPADRLVGVTPMRYETVRSHMIPYTALGTDFASLRKTSPYFRVEGAWPSQPGELLAGVDVAQKGNLAPGHKLKLDGRNDRQEKYDKEFTITGILASGGPEDGFLVMSLADMEEMTGQGDRLDLAEASLTVDGAALSRLAQAIKEQVPGIEARLVTQVTNSEATVLGKLTFLVYLVTAVVLTLTTICVTTTMMTVVIERRREIGLKKALGAENRRIAREFLSEGLVLGVAGGLLGSLCGVGFARLVSLSVFGRAMVTTGGYLIPITVLVSIVVTILSCLAPVRKAVDVDPALVLKGE
jgi:putative ABC transport system permease protein